MWEFKFVFRDDRLAEPFFEMLARMPEICGYRCRPQRSVRRVDHYFDTSKLKLDSIGTVLRIRQYGSSRNLEAVVKRQALGRNRETVYHSSGSVGISAKQLSRLQAGELPAVLQKPLAPFRLKERLANVASLVVDRQEILLSGRAGATAKLHLDRIEAIFPGQVRETIRDFEIELKSDQAAFPLSDRLRDYLQSVCGLIPITRSKLRRLSRSLARTAEPQPVILDMDTGVDDALAILLAMRSPELRVLGITTVGGNVDGAQTVKNTAAVLQQIWPMVRDRYPELPPVAQGRSLRTGAADASNVHGPDGLGGVSEKYFNPSANVLPNATRLFTDIVGSQKSKSVTLITTGPLSNLSGWIDCHPDSVERLKEVIAMGGVFFQAGNRSQVAEFNVHSDPDAARRVTEFCRGDGKPKKHVQTPTVPLTFVGLDVTHQVRFHREDLQRASARKGSDRHLDFIRGASRHYMRFYYRNEGLNGCYLHDPLAIGFAIDPSICQAESYHVEVENHGVFTSGMSVADDRPTRLFKNQALQATGVCYKVDAERFERLFQQRVLGGLGK